MSWLILLSFVNIITISSRKSDEHFEARLFWMVSWTNWRCVSVVCEALMLLFMRQDDNISEDEIMQMMSNLGMDGDMPGEADFLPMMQTMMKDLLSKDVLYPSLKEITAQVFLSFIILFLYSPTFLRQQRFTSELTPAGIS